MLGFCYVALSDLAMRSKHVCPHYLRSVPSTLGMAPTRGGPTGRTPVAQSLQGMAEEWVESAHFPTKLGPWLMGHVIAASVVILLLPG